MTSDPFDTLELGIDEEWPSGTGDNDGGVLERHGIVGQIFIRPLGHFGGVGEDFNGFNLFGDRNLLVEDGWVPSF